MSKITLAPNASGTGTLTVAAPNTNSDYTLTLPAETGTVLTSGGAIDVNASAPADSLAISSTGAVGIGTTSPGQKLQLSGSTSQYISILNTAAGNTGVLFGDSDRTDSGYVIYANADNYMSFGTGGSSGVSGTERVRIDSSGNLLVGRTVSDYLANDDGIVVGQNGVMVLAASGTSARNRISFVNGIGGTPAEVGAIQTNGSATSYLTSSDYRLKENIAPMTGALATVQQLNPVTYNWKVDGSAGQGFIAHELQAVVPDCVTGEKDAVETYVDEEGVEQTRPVYQGIDTSFLVATLTAAIKEQQAIIESLTARIEALEAANVPT